MNVTLESGAAAGWTGVWEYASAVDAAGKPTAWKTLTLGQDGTNGLKQSGRITFDPPADWVTASIGGSDRLYYVRFRVTAGTAAQDPELKTVFGRDYVGANGDRHGNDPGVRLRGRQERRRLPERRRVRDPRNRGWTPGSCTSRGCSTRSTGRCGSSRTRRTRRAAVGGRLPRPPAERHPAGRRCVRRQRERAASRSPACPCIEPTATFSIDSGALVAAISRAIAPKWVLANTAGGGADAAADRGRVGGRVRRVPASPAARRTGRRSGTR